MPILTELRPIREMIRYKRVTPSSHFGDEVYQVGRRFFDSTHVSFGASSPPATSVYESRWLMRRKDSSRIKIVSDSHLPKVQIKQYAASKNEGKPVSMTIAVPFIEKLALSTSGNGGLHVEVEGDLGKITNGKSVDLTVNGSVGSINSAEKIVITGDCKSADITYGQLQVGRRIDTLVSYEGTVIAGEAGKITNKGGKVLIVGDAGTVLTTSTPTEKGVVFVGGSITGLANKEDPWGEISNGQLHVAGTIEENPEAILAGENPIRWGLKEIFPGISEDILLQLRQA